MVVRSIPGIFAEDWNRSYILEPAGPPVGAAVFLHGLTDSPYSLRHIARRYLRARLSLDSYEVACSWHGPRRLDGRGMGRLVGGHTAGRQRSPQTHWSLGSVAPGRVFERRCACLDVCARGARQHRADTNRIACADFADGRNHELCPLRRARRVAGDIPGLCEGRVAQRAARVQSVQVQFVSGQRRATVVPSDRGPAKEDVRSARDGRLVDLPPVITFQSVMDSTVSTRAIVSAFYFHLPANGSELVLFDLNRSTKFGPLLRSASDTLLTRLLPEPPRRFRTTIITNASPDSDEVVERVRRLARLRNGRKSWGCPIRLDVFSLSHVALPFPTSDSLYGLQPDPARISALISARLPRGESGARSSSIWIRCFACRPIRSFLI